MNPAAKPKPASRASARLKQSAATYEDDAEQALKEIMAATGKADRITQDSAKPSRRKPANNRE
jgi:hypothetical protein